MDIGTTYIFKFILCRNSFFSTFQIIVEIFTVNVSH